MTSDDARAAVMAYSKLTEHLWLNIDDLMFQGVTLRVDDRYRDFLFVFSETDSELLIRRTCSGGCSLLLLIPPSDPPTPFFLGTRACRSSCCTAPDGADDGTR